MEGSVVYGVKVMCMVVMGVAWAVSAQAAERDVKMPAPDCFKHPVEGAVCKEPAVGMAFVWVPGGRFQMGSDDGRSSEKPLHQVTLDGFWLGKYEVTHGQWRAVMGLNSTDSKKGDDYPVEEISWNDAQQFILKMNSKGQGGFRLPSEAEWEYACRSGGKKEKYSGSSSADSVAWYKSNSGAETHRVGSKAANGLGLHDMSGNVLELVQDVFGSYSSGLQHNPIYEGNGSYRVSRGGSWYYSAKNVRCASRDRDDPGDRSNNLGLRLARTAQ